MFTPKRPVEPRERLRRRGIPPMNHPKLYNPLIYTYKCRGMYYASDDTKSGNHEGICKGIKTKLEVLVDANQETITRSEALKRFTTMSADFDLDEYEGTNNDTSELHQQAKTILLSPALIYKDDEQTKKDNSSTRESKTVNFLSSKGENVIPEEELIKRQEWTCYGSTEVEYLVLQNIETGDRKIAAVAPRNTGISFREIETDDSLRSITRVGLGWLDIIHDNNSIYTDDDSTDTDNNNEKSSISNKNNNNKITDKVSYPEEVPPRPTTDAIETAQQSITRTYNFSKKVFEHMKYNTEWLIGNLQDDFPSRTYTAGCKILEHLPKTIDQTSTMMGKILQQLFDDDDDDDDDNNYGGRGPGRYPGR